MNGVLPGRNIPGGCLDQCATPDVCRLKGCRELRLREIGEEALLQARLAALSLTPPVMMIDRALIIEPRVRESSNYELLAAQWRFADLRTNWDYPVEVGQSYSPNWHIMGQGHRLPPNNSYEQGIIDAHSTPGLKKHELTRTDKKEQLNSHGMGKFPEDRDKILDALYPKA